MAHRQISAAQSFLLIAVALLALTTSCWAAIAWEKAKEHPAYPGQCMWGGKIGSFDEEFAVFYQPGDSWDIGDCIRASCEDMSDGLFIEYASCGVIGVEPPCITVPGNRSLSYPDCCPSAWCPELPQTDDSMLATNQISAESEQNERFYRHAFHI